MGINDPLVEVIKEGEIMRMTQSRAREEDLFVLREVIEPKDPVFEESSLTKDKFRDLSKTNVSLGDWRKSKVTQKRNDVLHALKDNFHWGISKARRDRNLTRKQLADAIDVSEGELKVVELGDLPRDDFILISKIENHLGISLRKEIKSQGVTLSDLQKMNEGKVQEEIKKVYVKEESKEVGNDISGDDLEILEE